MSYTIYVEQRYHRDPALNEFYTLLESHVETKKFYVEMMRLISRRPHFFGPYVELADYLESLGLAAEHRAFMDFSIRRLRELFFTQALLVSARESFTQKDASYAQQLLLRHKDLCGATAKGMLLGLLTKSLYNQSAPDPEREYVNLRLVAHEPDMARIQRELKENEQWWSYDTSRQDSIPLHQRTNAIILRQRNYTKGREYNPADFEHQSERTPLAGLFPHTLKVIEDFAKEQKGCLGRVVVVRLRARSKVYRHFDGEPWLATENRYHFVLVSRGGSLMTSGIEQRTFKEGDLFYFENKKMHTAENNSNDWRAHVIFDMQEGPAPAVTPA